jgi:hypothetical protein
MQGHNAPILSPELPFKKAYFILHDKLSVVDPDISKRGDPLRRGGDPPKKQNIHVFWVSNPGEKGGARAPCPL